MRDNTNKWICLLIIACFSVKVSCTAIETMLYNDLFSGYNPRLRPLDDSTKVLNVGLEFELVTINGIQETDQVLSTTAFVAAEWEDEHLKWNPVQYGGIEHLVIPPSDVWLPDIAVSNSATTFYKSTYTRDFRVDLKSTGRVIWKFGGQFETSCTLDMTYYPFDKQKCTIEIENWSYSSDAVALRNLTAEVKKASSYSPNGEWQLDETAVEVSAYHKDTHPGKDFPRVTYSLSLTRKPGYYFINIIAPCLFCILVALMVFWLPPESGEKVSLGITVLLAISVFQLVVADNTPQTSDFTPQLILLMTTIMGMTTLSTLSSIFVLYIYHHPTTTSPPVWVQKMTLVLSKVVCLKPLVDLGDEGDEMKDKDDMDAEKVTVRGMDVSVVTPEKTVQKRGDASELDQVLALMKFLVNYVKNMQGDSAVADKWKTIALVLDRICFWLTLLSCIICFPIYLGQSDPSH